MHNAPLNRSVLRPKQNPPTIVQRVLRFGLLLLAMASFTARADDSPDIGFLFDQFGLTLTPGERVEAVGPFYYREQQESMRIWAVPPVLSYSRDPATELLEFNLVYPVFTYIRYGDQYRLQLFQLLAWAGGPTQTEPERHRFTIFPVYFQQRSSDPTQNYTAAGPFYGHLQKRLMRDETRYIMFPLYSQTRKRDVITDNYLYPLFHVRRGEGLTGWQFWPLYGHEHKVVTSFTNRFGDLEWVPGHERKFALWPIYFDTREGMGSENPKRQQAILPFYSITRSPLRDQTTVLWPLFSYIDEREKNYHEWQLPWPIIGFARGEGKTINRVLPFYSHAQSSNLQSDSILLPLYKFNRVLSTGVDRQRHRVLFFLFSDVTEKNLDTGQSQRRTDLWPLFTRRRDLNGNTRLQVLSVLEPILPENHNIELEYSPVWSLWRSEKNAKTGAASQSLLWNFYRRETTPISKKVSAFFGLYQYRKDIEGKRVKLFFIPL